VGVGVEGGRGSALHEAQKNLSPGQRDPPPGDWASSRVSRPMRRMFRDLFGYIRGIQVNVALTRTDREKGINRGRCTRLRN
jgi:hypothetical protein